MKDHPFTKSHLCIDGYNADTLALRNEELLSIYFRAVKKSAFTRILYFPDDAGDAMEGVTGCLLAPGYHTTVHTYTNKQKRSYFLDFFGFEEKKHRNALTYLDGSYEAGYNLQHTLQRKDHTSLPSAQDASNTKVYGPHLMTEIQLQEKNPSVIRKYIKEFLEDLPRHIDMHPLTNTFQVESKEWISSLRVIAESHLSIHYHIDSQVLFLDVFSCKPFNHNKVLYLLKEKFPSKNSSYSIIERGLHFPRTSLSNNLHQSEKILIAETV